MKGTSKMTDQFKGKVAIVTGSSAGIGEAIALLFASKGASVTLCGRDEVRLRSVLDKAEKVSGGHKDRFISVQGDVRDPNIRKQIVEKTVQTFGRLDILVPNSGIFGLNRSILESTEENFDAVMDTNLKSVYFIIQLAVPHLEKTRGCIVNISSILSHMIHSNTTVYPMFKAALDHLTRSLAVELGPRGIRVNCVNPGYFSTLIMNYQDDGGLVDRNFTETTEKYKPLKGRTGVVDDIARAVVFLASDDAGFITGELLKVDGGRSMAGPFDR